jgi:hypothetical protein
LLAQWKIMIAQRFNAGEPSLYKSESPGRDERNSHGAPSP